MTTTEAETRDALSVDQALIERRSVRHFRLDDVPRDIVMETLTCAQWAPSPHNSQPWRFTILTHLDHKERLGHAMGERLHEDLLSARVPEAGIVRQVERSRSRISSAPVVIICSLVADGLASHADERHSSLEWAMAVQSVGAVLQSIFLSAFVRGLGTCWMAAPMYCPQEVRDALALPASFEPQALILMGYPAIQGKVRPRRNLLGVVDFR